MSGSPSPPVVRRYIIPRPLSGFFFPLSPWLCRLRCARPPPFLGDPSPRGGGGWVPPPIVRRHFILRMCGWVSPPPPILPPPSPVVCVRFATRPLPELFPSDLRSPVFLIPVEITEEWNGRNIFQGMTMREVIYLFASFFGFYYCFERWHKVNIFLVVFRIFTQCHFFGCSYRVYCSLFSPKFSSDSAPVAPFLAPFSETNKYMTLRYCSFCSESSES